MRSSVTMCSAQTKLWGSANYTQHSQIRIKNDGNHARHHKSISNWCSHLIKYHMEGRWMTKTVEKYMWRLFKGFFIIITEFTDSRVYKGFVRARYKEASITHFYRTRTIIAWEAYTSVASFYKRIVLRSYGAFRESFSLPHIIQLDSTGVHRTVKKWKAAQTK